MTKSHDREAEARFIFQDWFQTKIARHEVQLTLYYLYFEIKTKNQIQSSNCEQSNAPIVFKKSNFIDCISENSHLFQKSQTKDLCLKLNCTSACKIPLFQKSLTIIHPTIILNLG